MELSKMSDLDLAKAQGQLYQQFMQIQGNLIAINGEIDKRTPKVELTQSKPEQPKE